MNVRSRAGRNRRASQRRWHVRLVPFFAGLIAWIGILVLLYPMVASWFAQYNQSKIITQSAVVSTKADKAYERAELTAAHAYNDALRSGAVYSADENVPTSTAGIAMHSRYESLLNADPTGLLGRIQIPSISLDLPIYHGTSDATLLRGVGHLEGTSLPVGGAGTHAVLTGHRGLATATMFTNLNLVKDGDTFTISVFGEVMSYQVIRTRVVDPDQTSSLAAVPGKDLVTLVTCTPLGINTQRILVTGERVYPTPANALAEARSAPTIPSFPWWAVIVGAGTIAIGVYLWRSGYSRDRDGGDAAGGTGRSDAFNTLKR